jgi:hypothetical protein
LCRRPSAEISIVAVAPPRLSKEFIRLRVLLASASCSLYCCGGAAPAVELLAAPELIAAPPVPNPPAPLSMISGFSGFMLSTSVSTGIEDGDAGSVFSGVFASG